MNSKKANKMLYEFFLISGVDKNLTPVKKRRRKNSIFFIQSLENKVTSVEIFVGKSQFVKYSKT
jgi:hypothetical protein